MRYALLLVLVACAPSGSWGDRVVREKYTRAGAGYVVGGSRYGGGTVINSTSYRLVSRDGMVCNVSEREYALAEIGKLHSCAWEEL